MDAITVKALFELLLRIGDERLVAGQCLSQWCGHGPALEEDIALTNISLDLIGHAQTCLQYAGEIEGAGRDADTLAFFRETREFRNSNLAEQPRGDFALTTLKLFLCSAFNYLQWEVLAKSSDSRLAGISQKAQKETRYHLTHSSEWVLRLGDGTEESNQKAQTALDDLWRFTPDLFFTDSTERQLEALGIIPSMDRIQTAWATMVSEVLQAATLKIPKIEPGLPAGGRVGQHTEHLGLLLAEMQILPRSYPDARW